MKDLDKSLEHDLRNIKEAKKLSLEKKIDALQHLILQRYQALITISSISFAVIAITFTIKSELIQNKFLALLSLVLLILIALVSLGRHLYLLRDDINSIAKKIKDLPEEDWSRPLEEKGFKADWWPETLYILLIISILLFGLSFFI